MLAEADLVLLARQAARLLAPLRPGLRARLSDRGGGRRARRAQRRIALALGADPAGAATRLAEAAATRTGSRSSWREQVEGARQASPPEWTEWRRSSREPIHPLRVCAALAPHVAAGAVLVCDGGEFGQWVQAGLERASACSTG